LWQPAFDTLLQTAKTGRQDEWLAQHAQRRGMTRHQNLLCG